MTRILAVLIAFTAVLHVPQAAASPPATQVTVIVDAFGADAALDKDWGYAALIEYGGKRILFDTGNNEEKFVENARRLGIALNGLDAVVISHRHGDHTAGLRHVLALNPGIRVFAPDDEAFSDTTPPAFFAHPDPALPSAQRYFGGKVPAHLSHGIAWPNANFVRVSDRTDIGPGMHVIRAVASDGPFVDVREVSLMLDTPSGEVVIVGCAHPGIETILSRVAKPGARIAMVVGGLHLVDQDQSSVEHLAARLRGQWGIARIAPGHCTGELAFAALARVFGKNYVLAGVGARIPVTSDPG